MEEQENRLYTIRYDDGPWKEVVAPDPDTAQKLTEPPRDEAGKRTWKRALLGDITPDPSEVCRL